VCLQMKRARTRWTFDNINYGWFLGSRISSVLILFVTPWPM
jgi:hypothetical protein